MSSDPNDIFGGDILLDEDRIPIVAANGELVWCDGLAAAVQDIKLRVFTRLRGLFYDIDFGSTIPDYIHEDSTKLNRMSLNAEVQRRIEMDSRVLTGSVTSLILKWYDNGVHFFANWVFLDVEEPQNITITLQRPGAARVVEDVSLEDD